MDEENRYRTNTIYRACMLLKEIAESDDPVNITEVMDILEVKIDVAFRTVKTLEEVGFLQACEGGYILGEGVALLWKSFRTSQRATIERARKTLIDTAITGEKE